jgi:hypothetical protein
MALNVGDNGLLVDGKLIDAIAPSVGDTGVLLNGTVIKATAPSIGDKCIAYPKQGGGWIVFTTSQVCQETVPSGGYAIYAGWCGVNGLVYQVWYNDGGGYSCDPLEAPPHDEMVYVPMNCDTFEISGDVVRFPYTYCYNNSILLGQAYTPSFEYRTPGQYCGDGTYFWDAYGKYNSYYPFTNLNAVSKRSYGWGMSDYFGYYNPFSSDQSYHLYDNGYNLQYSGALSLSTLYTGMGAGDLNDFYTWDEYTGKINRYEPKGTTPIATSVNSYSGTLEWSGMLLLDDSLLLGLSFTKYGGKPTGGVRLDRDTLAVMDLIQD